MKKIFLLIVLALTIKTIKAKSIIKIIKEVK
jgi:hypothetical protein